MKVALDISNTAGFRTGTEEYIEGLVYGLARAGVQVSGVGRSGQALLPDKPRLGLEIRPKPSPLAKWWWEYYGVRRVPGDFDVLHIPFMAHPEVQLAIPTVVTVHDLIPYRLASYRHNLKERRYFAHVERGLRYADRLVAISEATMADLRDVFPDLADRTVVIPNGVHADFYGDLDVERAGSVARRFGLRRRPRILYVGGYDERKNVPTLIRALAQVFERVKEGELVLVGAKDNLAIRRQLAEEGIEGRAVVTPFVNRSELVALYHSADLFVYPSRYEGFGMPPAQALAVGVPVIAGDTPAVREVVGDYGVLVPPDDVEAWRVAIQEALDSPVALHQRAENGQHYAEVFRWEAISQHYLSVYQQATKGRAL
ncbi:glycosyltransferase family 4 protein [Sulfobacillus harzensis]|uniref:Glycosyltransferase family 4 protein n=1 Tax=Sulfobacillus harzensis TaxID=2729629 RepID=A0A7Y0Q330_9FIRM|nr:glycosyltransferase family 1 protein [Sulfobacillus harzensis]NMP22531.1 glycosyltransferase family 4 protein [Sulfobacillus harzensis]